MIPVFLHLLGISSYDVVRGLLGMQHALGRHPVLAAHTRLFHVGGCLDKTAKQTLTWTAVKLLGSPPSCFALTLTRFFLLTPACR